MCLLVAALFGASSAKASTIGDPVDVDFNYVGISVEATGLGGINDMVLAPDDALGALEMRGEYTSTTGDFVVPKVGGLTFPDLSVDLGIALDADIALTADAIGNYNSATGAMTLNPKISLNIGVDDLSQIPIPLGTGALGCEFAPLDISLSTAGVWPATGSPFAIPGSIQNGSLSGAWTVKPDVVATVGEQGTCDLIGGLLAPVGGLWLAQSNSPVSYVAASDSLKPPAAVCEEGFTGTPPNCEEIPVVTDPAKVSVKKPKGATIKRGKKGVVKVTVSNTGDENAAGVKVCGKISKKVGTTGCASLGTIAAGKSKTAKLKIKTSKKAKGKTTLKISVSSKGAGKAATKATIKIKK